MVKLFILVLIHDIILAFGHTFIKQGVSCLGDRSIRSIRGILYFIKYCVTRAKVWLGFSLNTVSFFIWLIILSFADLSLAYPFESMHYIMVTILAKVYLREKVNGLRWAGILLVVTGVAIVSLG
jgi:drug/metabolite transporter (DMT)-like permease